MDDLRENTLETVLKELPELSGLHVVQCPHVDHVAVLGLLNLTPQLENVSFTTLVCTPGLYFCLNEFR